MKSEEIDLVELVGRLWARRWFIALVAAGFMVAGVVIALTKANAYTAQCVMIPQTGGGGSMGNLGGLAAMAGINLGSMGGDALSPDIYPAILASVPLQKELMRTEVDTEKGRVALIDMFGGEVAGAETPEVAGVETLTRREAAARNALKSVVKMESNDGDGSITLSATMGEPVAAAEVAVAAQELMQKYITAFKTEKVASTLAFVEARLEEAREAFVRTQSALATFQDRNRNMITQVGIAREAQLQQDFDLAAGVYSELATQREQARIEVKKETPVFTIIEPIVVPTERSAPRRKLIVMGATMLGFVLACGWVLLMPSRLTSFRGAPKGRRGIS